MLTRLAAGRSPSAAGRCLSCGSSRLTACCHNCLPVRPRTASIAFPVQTWPRFSDSAISTALNPGCPPWPRMHLDCVRPARSVHWPEGGRHGGDSGCAVRTVRAGHAPGVGVLRPLRSPARSDSQSDNRESTGQSYPIGSATKRQVRRLGPIRPALRRAGVLRWGPNLRANCPLRRGPGLLDLTDGLSRVGAASVSESRLLLHRGRPGRLVLSRRARGLPPALADVPIDAAALFPQAPSIDGAFSLGGWV